MRNRYIRHSKYLNIHSQLHYHNQLYQVAITTNNNESNVGNKSKSLEKSLIKPFQFSKQELKDLKIGRYANTTLEEIKKK